MIEEKFSMTKIENESLYITDKEFLSHNTVNLRFFVRKKIHFLVLKCVYFIKIT